ncbi:sensor histidine kinase [Streptomyces sp. ISL-96]|uniref:sensor histidine kinase n=1 Tax=Streptomyces sp. ISL-96 TaxID=2819191 RepID=UPI001BEB9815|nr:ATP-binding protein [Streptomyces sp. ISL-96]MBT2493706.1 sensor histidine kinase [Streptomyces sp. ISL-96]
MRLAVIPVAGMAVVSAATVVFVLLSQEGTADATTWGVLAAATVLGCSFLGGAVVASNSEAQRRAQRYARLYRTAAGGELHLQALLRRLKDGERLEPPPFPHEAPAEGDALGRVEYAIQLGQWQAGAALIQAARPAAHTAASTAKPARPTPEGNRAKVEVFVNLARRLQSLVHRQIKELDDLEREVEDPELLKRIFFVDHLATRTRRHAENVAVLGGTVSRRQWTRPVALNEVLRSAIAEVEQYSRVKLVPPIEGTLQGHAVADVVHLLAELIENATVFSDPHTQVLLRSRIVTAGLAVEVEDRGLGIPVEDQARLNELLADPDHIDVGKLLADGRIGLFVVSALARRHSIPVTLQTNIYGGVQAVLVLPHRLLGEESVAAPQQGAEMPQHAPAASVQNPAAQGPPAAQPVAAQQVTSQPQPQLQPQAAAWGRPPTPPQHYRAAEPVTPRDDLHSPDAGANDRRPQLPKRRAQENLVPELRDTPKTRTTGDEQEAEPTPGLLGAFRQGWGLADDASSGSPADSDRY